MTELEVYLILKLDSIIIVLSILLAGLAITLLAYAIYFWILCDTSGEQSVNEVEKARRKALFFRKLKIFMPIICILFLITMFFPTTKQMVLVKVVPAVVNNKEVQKLPDNILRLVNGWLEQTAADIKKD